MLHFDDKPIDWPAGAKFHTHFQKADDRVSETADLHRPEWAPQHLQG